MGENIDRLIAGLENELAYANQAGDKDKAAEVKKSIKAAKSQKAKAAQNVEPSEPETDPADTADADNGEEPEPAAEPSSKKKGK